MSFKKIALAVTFSPNTKALLLESKRLKTLFNSELILIHVGEKKDTFKTALKELLDEVKLEEKDIKLIVKDGDVEDVLVDICDREQIDLLIAGALVKENFYKYYIGSVARTLMREAPCSLLLITNPSESREAYKNICVSVDFSTQSETAVKKAYQIYQLEKSSRFNLIREFEIPGLAITILDSGSKDETVKQREMWLDEEKQKLNVFLNELNIPPKNVNTICLFGKQGWEASSWVIQNEGDLFVIPAPSRKSNLIDRIFQHDWEYIFKQLPCSLMIIKPEE
jgi:nucleotide-binding universal stress UspA family protein